MESCNNMIHSQIGIDNLSNFGKDNIEHVYQTYLPMHNSLVKEAEMKMLCLYYKKYNNIPACNPKSDLRRVKLRIGN